MYGAFKQDSSIEVKIMLEVSKAEYIEEYRIRITFNNGASGVVDLKEALWGTMFENLKDYNAFRKFEVPLRQLITTETATTVGF